MTKERITDINLLSPKEILKLGLEGKRHEMIDVDNVIIDESLVDESHKKELVKSMSGKRGQISPITVRARLNDNGIVVYDIIDGFHRGAGFKDAGIDKVDAVVLYGCSDEEMYDLRVLAANSVKSVKFARISTWMQGSYKRSEWCEKGFSLSQILALAVQNSSGVKLKLSKEEASRAKNWAKEKTQKWGKTLGSILQDVYIIENADPALISRVRTTGGGSRGRGVLSPARLRSIVNVFPKDYQTQNFLAGLVINKNLNAEEIFEIANLIKENKELVDMEILNNDPKRLLYSRRINDGTVPVDSELDDEEFEESDNFLDENYGIDTMDEKAKKGKGLKVIYRNLDPNGNNYEKKGDLRVKVEQLQRINEALREVKDKDNGSNSEDWFLLINDLSTKEIALLTGIFKENRDPESVISETGLTEKQFSQSIMSILKKRYVQNLDQRIFNEVSDKK